MPDTVTVNIDNVDWTEIQQGVSGLITNHSQDDVQVREAAVKPDASVTIGHVVHPRDNITYGIEGSQKIFARSNKAAAQLVITEG